MYTEKEIQAAKEFRDMIISEGLEDLKPAFIAGEIVKWDEMRNYNDEEGYTYLLQQLRRKNDELLPDKIKAP